MAGSDLYWARAEGELRRLADELAIPVFLNGLGRGCLPADHELAFSRTRSAALAGADVALVIGVPMDFRLAFGAVFDEDAQVIVVDSVEPERTPPRPVAAECYGDIPLALASIADGCDGPLDTTAWVAHLRAQEDQKRATELGELQDQRAPLHPMRIYGELAGMLDRDAIVVGDGGDFVSYAGRVVDSFDPGCWVDPGPFGCLGSGPGYALAAKLAHPERQVVLLLGDGAFGFSGMEFDTLSRHGVNVVAVVGNNGIWALEKHPMQALYGYSVIADLRPGTRYDVVVRGARLPRRVRRAPRGAPPRAGARLRRRITGARERADRPRRRLPAAVEPRVAAHAARASLRAAPARMSRSETSTDSNPKRFIDS